MAVEETKNTSSKPYKLLEYIEQSHNVTRELLDRIHEDIKTRDILSSVVISVEDRTVCQLPPEVLMGGLRSGDGEVQVWNYEDWRRFEADSLTTVYDRNRFFRSTSIENICRKVKEHLQYSFVARSSDIDNSDRVIKYSFICMCPECRVILGTRQEITKSLEHDFLTGGLNREGLLRELTQKLRERRPDVQYSLLCFNIKSFRIINELHGSAVGDKVLQQMYTSMVYSELNPLSYARFEADNFICLIRRKDLDLDVVARLCQQECVVGDLKVGFRCLCGIYHIEDDITAFKACAHARLAISYIKDQFITPWMVFEPKMQQIAISDSEILNQIDEAIVRREFVPYYQPVVNVQTGRVEMAEALVRWQSRDHGMISPGMFIPVLERNGGLSRIDKLMEQSVFDLQRKRLAEGKTVVPIDLNLSWSDFADTHMISQLQEHILDASVPTDLLRFEITESAYEEIAENRKDVLKFFQDHEVKLLVDDFGQGYSFGTMKNVDFHIVKLDKSLIDKLGQSRKMDLLVKSFIDVFHSLNSKVVAEGVEEAHQLEYLRQVGCDYIQGYYFYKPMDEASFLRLIDSTNALPQEGKEPGLDPSLMSDILLNEHLQLEQAELLRKTVEESNCMRMLLDEMNIHLFEWDVKTHDDVASTKFCQMYGLPDNILHDMPNNCPLVLSEDQERFREFYGRIERGEKMGSDCFRLFTPDLSGYTWFRKTFYTLFDKDGLPFKAIITMQDCQDEYRFKMLRTRDRMLTQQQEIVTFIYTLTDDTISITFRDLQGEVNTATMPHFLAKPADELLEDQRLIAGNLRQIIADGRRTGYFDFNFATLGAEYRAHFSIVNGEYGHLYAIIGQAEDINKTRERLEAKEQLIRLSELDGLTQLRTRASGEREMAKLLSQNVPGVFGVLDCDKFKCVNDTFGHVVGDAMLVAVAKALMELDPNGVYVRLGGDEFGFCINGLAERAQIEGRIHQFFDRISSLDVPGMTDFPISVSVGAVTYDGQHPADFDSLYRQADMLLYDSKKYFGNRLTM